MSQHEMRSIRTRQSSRSRSRGVQHSSGSSADLKDFILVIPATTTTKTETSVPCTTTTTTTTKTETMQQHAHDIRGVPIHDIFFKKSRATDVVFPKLTFQLPPARLTAQPGPTTSSKTYLFRVQHESATPFFEKLAHTCQRRLHRHVYNPIVKETSLTSQGGTVIRLTVFDDDEAAIQWYNNEGVFLETVETADLKEEPVHALLEFSGVSRQYMKIKIVQVKMYDGQLDQHEHRHHHVWHFQDDDDDL
jgi:hypothetical protein